MIHLFTSYSLDLLPQHLTPVPCLQKTAGLSWTSTKHVTTKHSKTCHKSSHQVWVRQPSRKKRVPRAGKSVRDTLNTHCQESSPKHQNNNHNINTEDPCRFWIVSSVSVRPHELGSVDFMVLREAFSCVYTSLF